MLSLQARLGHGADILAIDEDRATFQVEEAEQQADEGRLAGAGQADESHLFAGTHGERQTVDHLLPLPVFEPDVFELDFAG